MAQRRDAFSSDEVWFMVTSSSKSMSSRDQTPSAGDGDSGSSAGYGTVIVEDQDVHRPAICL